MATNPDISHKVGLWRDRPVCKPLRSGATSFDLRNVFPSGRQALSISLSQVGLGRSHRVAVPEWSSHCVISAVGRYAMPIPVTEVVRETIKVDAVLIYEQWGWPLFDTAIEQLCDSFKDKIFVRDVVDSPHFSTTSHLFGGFKRVIEIISLSKILGLPGGGLAIADGQYSSFSAEPDSKTLINFFESKMTSELGLGKVRSFFKESIVAVPSEIVKWVEDNDLFGALESERLSRQENLIKILKTPLADKWPGWMKEAVRQGAGPGIAPLMKGCSQSDMLATRDSLLKLHGIESCVYHFNWTGNPIEPEYEKCLAFPVHGLVHDIESVLNSFKIA